MVIIQKLNFFVIPVIFSIFGRRNDHFYSNRLIIISQFEKYNF